MKMDKYFNKGLEFREWLNGEKGKDIGGKYAEVVVSDDVILSDGDGLANLPKKLRVEGYINLCECTSLTSLPDGMRVGGSLYLHGCTSLTSLPDGLRVGGYLDLHGCTSLTSLPSGLEVGGDLDVGGSGLSDLKGHPGVKGKMVYK